MFGFGQFWQYILCSIVALSEQYLHCCTLAFLAVLSLHLLCKTTRGIRSQSQTVCDQNKLLRRGGISVGLETLFPRWIFSRHGIYCTFLKSHFQPLTIFFRKTNAFLVVLFIGDGVHIFHETWHSLKSVQN